ncbi:hypothetical protein [Thalassospira mesophila]|uniref:Lipoprotein n=1 Tax=Thalassospira mesophila TaxID=1293891 RepID=A0A1Y2L6H0_9PROT|nr:hypothetical protein [Thalassospira mesophila]OSQ40748.1 hypothetical protein TMES_03385 [Thalassospira mesophila]
MDIYGVKKQIRRGCICAMLALLAACAQKADALKLSAHQFGVETGQAISALNDLRTAQFSAPIRSRDAQQAGFIANLAQFTGTLTAQNLPILINPDAITIDPAENARWQHEMANLRTQYQSFAAIFSDIGQDDIFGASTIKASAPLLRKLRSQLASLAQTLGTSPPVFLVRRDALVASINKIHSNSSLPEAARTSQIKEWWQQWQNLNRDEKTAYQNALHHFVTAGQLGEQLQNQIENYDKISTQTVLVGIDKGLRLVAENRDLSESQLKQKARSMMDSITKQAQP